MYVNNMNYLYTYVTHNDRYFNSLVDSSKKQNIDIVIRGMGHKWEGYVCCFSPMRFPQVVVCPLHRLLGEGYDQI